VCLKMKVSWLVVATILVCFHYVDYNNFCLSFSIVQLTCPSGAIVWQAPFQVKSGCLLNWVSLVLFGCLL
jgi:hypothetical protein